MTWPQCGGIHQFRREAGAGVPVLARINILLYFAMQCVDTMICSETSVVRGRPDPEGSRLGRWDL